MWTSMRWLRIAAAAGALALATGAAGAQEKELVFGLQCDRTGATQTVGVFLCPGYHDYINLREQQGRHRGLQDPRARDRPRVQGAARHGGARALQEGRARCWTSLYGTPQTAALTKKLEEDKILGTSPGFGTAAAADGKRFPYVFPLAASYWSQAAAAIDFAKKQLGGSLKGKKIAYLYFDNPAGKEPLEVLADLSKQEGFEMRTFAVPSPGVEMGAQVIDITGRFKPDFVVTHLFGRSPSVSDQGAQGQGLSAEQGGRHGLGGLRSRHQGRREASRPPRATTPCSSPASARTSR